MSKIKEREKAIKLRLKGLSYSQIKEKLGTNKSTLSGWLKNMPLSSQKIKELRDWNPRRIENFRNTMRNKREDRLKKVFSLVSKDIGKLTKREFFIAGLFLYWGEGGKVDKYMVSFTNTDPAMVRFFVKWISEHLSFPKHKLGVILHLYKDMNIKNSIRYWSEEIGLRTNQFKKVYVKDSKLTGLTYKSGNGKGTCVVRANGRDITDYVMMGIKSLKQGF